MTARKRCAALALALCAFISSGCASILEGDTMSVAPHVGAAVTMQPGSAPEAANFDELKAVLMGFVAQRSESGQILIYSYEGDITEDIERACSEIKTAEPLGAYALSEITASATQIVSYWELDAELTYKRTKKQIDSIITVQSPREFRTRLMGFMGERISEAVVLTSEDDITEDGILADMREMYYENPLLALMLPSLGIEVFPPEGTSGERLFELSFNYGFTASLLALYNRQLNDTVSTIARTVRDGENGDKGDAMLLLELAWKLSGSCVYNEGRAAMIAEHGVQNFDATAYGALLSASAVGEGYAMAFKALCDELGIECYVVLGYMGNVVHAWNIVRLDGDYYHIDVAMCSKNGLETAFLLSDEDIAELYRWDRSDAKICSGALTYYDFVEPEPETEETDPEAQTEDLET